MKKLLLLFFSVIVSAQNTTSELQKLANLERKAASKIINFQPNVNTENYDLTYQKLEFTLNPSIKFISGKITSTYIALSAMSVLTFDMANELTVSSVKKNGVDLIFSESGNNELLITLPTTQAIGTSATVEVTYSGTPPNNGFSAFVKSTHAGVPIIWTLSEPFGARDWIIVFKMSCISTIGIAFQTLLQTVRNAYILRIGCYVNIDIVNLID